MESDIAYGRISTLEDLMDVLDSLFHDPSDHWDKFYEDRSRPVPFFTDVPDHTLKGFIAEGMIKPGKALEFGCGNGRNAVYLAEAGHTVDAVDASIRAIEWGQELASNKGEKVNFFHASIFDTNLEDGSYDLIYDGGCFHHLTPHRRLTYRDLVTRYLRPGGLLCINSFAPGFEDAGGPAPITDSEVYGSRKLGPGMAYSMEWLSAFFGGAGLDLVKAIPGIDIPRGGATFGKTFLHTGLFVMGGGAKMER